MNFKQFGGKVTAEWRTQYQQSPNWENGRFQNLETTQTDIPLSKVPGLIYKQLTGKGGRAPRLALPVRRLDQDAFLAQASETKFIWYGHAVVLMRMNGKTLLIDPMMGPDTTPIAPMTTRRFSENTLSLIDDFPEIDLMLLTHDHYDHLDFASIQKLKNKTRQYFVALGVKRHLIRWGIAPELITEFDWWNERMLGDISITFTPTRHFSGRGLRDRQQTLWGGWVFKTATENIWFSGDGGYGNHFGEIGARLGPFDFAFMECGQYNDDWRPIHLFPDESVLAALDAGVKKAMPVHWGGFALSYQHTWTEPAEAFVEAAGNQKLDFLTPVLGQIFNRHTAFQEKWWLDFV